MSTWLTWHPQQSILSILLSIVLYMYEYKKQECNLTSVEVTNGVLVLNFSFHEGSFFFLSSFIFSLALPPVVSRCLLLPPLTLCLDLCLSEDDFPLLECPSLSSLALLCSDWSDWTILSAPRLVAGGPLPFSEVPLARGAVGKLSEEWGGGVGCWLLESIRRWGTGDRLSKSSGVFCDLQEWCALSRTLSSHFFLNWHTSAILKLVKWQLEQHSTWVVLISAI